MAKKHVIKYWARLIQKGTFKEADIPEDIRDEVMSMSVTLPLREDMIKTDTTKEAVNPEVDE